LRAGRLSCPSCGGVLRSFAHSVIREVRELDGSSLLRPRRSICRGCGRSHVLLPYSTLLRRRDSVEVIGAALLARSEGRSITATARELGRHRETVRGWLRAFSSRAEEIRAHCTRLVAALDPLADPIEPSGDAFSDALGALGAAGRAAVLRFGPRPRWSALSFLTGGALLCNTSLPFHSP
ncbi:MAG: transposase, partial [Acidimicrobiales bacterium]